MDFKVIVCRDYDHMSETASALALAEIGRRRRARGECVLGLATGSTPVGLYKHLAKAANRGDFDAARVSSFNLDEYVGLPGDDPQQRVLHPESYSFYMVQELFGLLSVKFRRTLLPAGTLIDQAKMLSELEEFPGDWRLAGEDKGKAVIIKPDCSSKYLSWIRRGILGGYAAAIEAAGGIDLQVIGVGGRGHVGFHESGIPFDAGRTLLVRLDKNTIENAVADGHFPSVEESPRYAVSMGAELVFRARTVLLVANGPRKTAPISESLLKEPGCACPISHGRVSARKGTRVIYVLDQAAAAGILPEREKLRRGGIEIEDISSGSAAVKVAELKFFTDPVTRRWA